MTTHKLLTVAEFCAELNITKSTFYDWRAKGRGPRAIVLPSGGVRIRRTELDRFLESHEETSGSRRTRLRAA